MYTAKLKTVGKIFRLPGTLYSYNPIANGNINKTFKVDYIQSDGDIKSYLFQIINTYVFKNPAQIMANIDRVTRHISKKSDGGVCLHFHHTEDGANYYLCGENECWRVMNYVDSVTYNSSDDLTVVRYTGEAFGRFQTQLSDFDASLLYETIPDFHNTKKRLDKLFADADEDPVGRVESVREELDYIKSVAEYAEQLTDMFEKGMFPPRVTHNDTKSNNVLFDRRTKKPLVVIDLDTVMPGMAMYDFGDAVRFAANTAEEDEPDTDKVGLDLEKFRAFAEGYIPFVRDSLTPLEVDSMALGAFSITIELASRFLDDYITGDKYFKTNYENHNLVRTRCQLKLAQDMYAKREQMSDILRSI